MNMVIAELRGKVENIQKGSDRRKVEMNRLAQEIAGLHNEEQRAQERLKEVNLAIDVLTKQ